MIYYGKETRKALDNYLVSGLKPHWEYVKAVVIIKKAAAVVNSRLGQLDKSKAQAISNVCNEIKSGKFKDQFVVDPYQSGAGTSHHMNVNEVIANRASEISGLKIHPNDDVNMSQSTNDVIPAAIRITCLALLPSLITNLTGMSDLTNEKAGSFMNILKSGRTHLQDALPITLGQEFSSYARAAENDLERIQYASANLLKIGIGGTAVGTGINTHASYHKMMIGELRRLTGFDLRSSGNLFESANNTADFLELSSLLKILSQTLIRIGNDLRLLSSGPGTGFAEIELPEVQAGSSIMPGKVNPSIVEMLSMVCFQVIGYDQAILVASLSGQMELNVMTPLIAHNLFEQIKLLTNALKIFNEKCLKGITVNEKMCRFWFERSSGTAAILNPKLGYDRVAALVKLSLKSKKPLKNLILEKKLLSRRELDKLFSVKNLTRPNIPSK